MFDWRGYRDGWAGREPDSDDEGYVAAWKEGLVDRQRADRFPRLNPEASKTQGNVRQRLRGGENSFIFRVREDPRRKEA